MRQEKAMCVAGAEAADTAAVVGERRRHIRCNLYLPIRVWREDAVSASHGESTCTVNVSAGGLYFLACREYPVGSLLHVEFDGSRSGGGFGPGPGCRYRVKVVHRSDFIGPSKGGEREVRRGVGGAIEGGGSVGMPE